MQRNVVQYRSLAVAEVEVAEFDLPAKDGVSGNRRIGRGVVDGRFGLEQLVNAHHGGGAALEQIHNPAHGDDGPDEHDHVGAEGHERAHRDAMGEDQVAAGQQCNHHRHAEDEFQSGPEHAHELDQAKSAGNVLAVELLEEANLRLLAGKGSDQAGARIILLGLRGDVGKAGLDALEAVVDSGSEVLNEDAGDGHGRQRAQG